MSTLAPKKRKLDSSLPLPQERKGSDDIPESEQREIKTILVVGIGASAGGLEAFTQLLEGLPDDTGMAFVLVQHLDPKHESILTEILSRHTPMKVSQVTEGMAVKPNQVYVIPPNTSMSVKNDRLQLVPRAVTDRGVHMPIDFFLRSLAHDYQEQSIGVILSGTSSDGTLGLQAIKAEGGMTFAQEEKSAKHDGMPRSAILSGCVDIILEPRAIAMELVRIAKHLPSESSRTSALLAQGGNGIKEIFILLRKVTGVDFTGYKQNTIVRRIQRQMAMNKIENTQDFVRYLKEDCKHVEDLYRSMLILVTRFFRDPEAFELLKSHVFPILMKDKASDNPIRIWVPGCSTGEEVYSIAITLLEFLADKSGVQAIQFFGTDINEEALQKARAGIYIENIAQDIGVSRLRRFFSKVEGGYQINKTVRDLCLFSKHDVTRDPPFSRQRLISCRNLLIYFGSSFQKKVIPLFHYGLMPQGFLMLGTSEAIGEFSNIFALTNKRYRLYSRRDVLTRTPIEFPRVEYGQKIRTIKKTVGADSEIPSREFDLQKEMSRFLLESCTPVSVAINDEMEILQVHGRTSPYLELAAGKAGHKILKMATEGLFLPLRSLIHAAKKSGVRQRKKGIGVKYDGKTKNIDLEVVPIKGTSEKEGYYFILFHEVPQPTGKVAFSTLSGRGKSRSDETYFKKELGLKKQELTATKQYLQSVIEGQDTVNEELKSVNEEALSANEELQSTNEELETSREELQSTNEELNTVNEELRTRNLELDTLNDDLVNFIRAVQISVLMVGHDLRIRRFSPTAERQFKLIPTDIGRSITDIALNLDFPNLEELVLEVIHSAIAKEQEFRNRKGEWGCLHIRPYKTMNNKIDGAVIVLIDIDELKTNIEEVENTRNFSEAVIETVRGPLLVLDNTLSVKKTNKSFYETFQVPKEETVNKFIYDLGDGQWNIPKLRSLLEDILPKNTYLRDFDVDHIFPGVGRKIIRLNASRILQKGKATETILLSMEDITEKIQSEELTRSNTELKGFAYAASHDLQEPLRMISMHLEMLSKKYKDRPLDKEAYEYINIAVGGARRLKSLIDGLLTYSRVGTGVAEFHSTDCSAVVDQVLRDLQLGIIESGAEVAQDPLPTIVADSLQLGQVFQNLISNAIKFRSREHSPKIQISAKHTGKFFIFTVKDNGIGFEMEQAKNIFALFRRLHSKEEYPGTGIGLASCKKIVESHGGSIWAESLPGQGSTFFFTIAVPPNQGL